MFPTTTTKLFTLIFLFILVACESSEPEGNADPVEVALSYIDNYYLGIEVTTDGAQGVLIGVVDGKNSRYEYERLEYIRSRTRGEDIPADEVVTASESDLLLAHLDTLTLKMSKTGQKITQTFLVLSPEYEKLAAGSELRGRIKTRFPDISVNQLTPEAEARANFFTMMGRSDIDFSDFLLVDIGASNTLMSVFDYPRDTSISVEELPYGVRSTVLEVDPLLDLRVNRPGQRQKMERLVYDLLEVPLKMILRRDEFAKREKVVFMGGLVYKIIRTLDIPLTGRTIDFDSPTEADLSARFKEVLQSENPDLSRGPGYSPEELYASLSQLEIILEETGDREHVYFFERATWLPGHILSELILAEKRQGREN